MIIERLRRIRNGLDILYVIVDARQHDVSDEQLHKFYLELHYANYIGKNSANRYIEEIIKNEQSGLYLPDGYFDRGYVDIADLYQGEYSLAILGGNLIPMYISYIESTNQYLKFNHMTGSFEVYANRFIEQRRINNILSDYNWITEIKDFSCQNGIEFWGTEIMYGVDENEIKEYCSERKNTIWVSEEKKSVKQDLCFMMLLAPNAQLSTINKSLKSFRIPYRIEQRYTTRKGKKTRGIIIIDISESI